MGMCINICTINKIITYIIWKQFWNPATVLKSLKRFNVLLSINGAQRDAHHSFPWRGCQAILLCQNMFRIQNRVSQLEILKAINIISRRHLQTLPIQIQSNTALLAPETTAYIFHHQNIATHCLKMFNPFPGCSC